MNFLDWLENRQELAKAYKLKMAGVPQEPSHHPEGDALAHTRLVRKAIPNAIQELKSLQQNDPELSHVLSNLNFDLPPEEMNVLKMAAWLHDIGKPATTTVGGLPFLTRAPLTGKIQSIAHQDPKNYMPEIEDLESVAPPETIAFFKKHEPLIRFLVDHHMDFVAEKFSRTIVDEFFRDGKIINDVRIKLLLALMWSDKMGREPAEMVVRGIAKNAKKLALSAKFGLQRQKKRDNQSKPFEGGPDAFRAMLQKRGVDSASIEKAIQNKFGTNESFRTFLEMQEAQPTTIEANIPMTDKVHVVAKHLKNGDNGVVVYAVGGAVRDFLNGVQPKDIDLTTNLSEENIIKRLETPEARKDGIRIHKKESVDTFGVVFVFVDGHDFEVAPFRKDIGSADGRRPEAVERGTIQDDAMRRDLTMNNLYYDFEKNLILDFNPNGQGIEDAQNGVARPVGDPFERFDEDKIRVFRLVRFFSRFNPGIITDTLDERTRKAVEHYKEVHKQKGIFPERIYEEFTGGIKQSQNTSMFLKSLAALDLMQAVFPGMNVDVEGIDRIGNSKKLGVILAWLLRNNPNASRQLKALKYPNVVTDKVNFLHQLLDRFQGNPESISNIHGLIKQRDRFIDPNYDAEQKEQMSQEMKQDIIEFSQMAGVDLLNLDRATHFASYNVPKINGNELMQRLGISGPEVGAAMDQERDRHYSQSFQDYLKQSLPKSSANRIPS